LKPFDKNAPKRILALDGGGIRGILTLGYLKHIQTLLRKRHENEKLVLSDYYDLIGGTSTGAIIATCLVLGYDVDRVIDLYRTLGATIFGELRYPFIPRSGKILRSFMKETYKSANLEKILRQQLGDITLGDDAIRTGYSVTLKRADTFSLWTMSNHPEGIYFNENRHLKLWELCRASAAAPYYFRPKKLTYRSRNGTAMMEGAFIDGGVSLANNPAYQLFLVSTVPSFGFNWNVGEDNLFITSVGTGNGIQTNSVDEIVRRSALSWAPKIPDLFMTDALEMNTTLFQIFGKNCSTDEHIDRQFIGLSERYPEHKLFSYSRFNVWFDEKTLTGLGLSKLVPRISSLVEMDHHENIEDLLRIGLHAGEQIADRNFPSRFDLRQSS
jgi:uncharacterized protein